MNTAAFYRMETITDTHVGTGESGFGFIDNLIQRDSATGYPCFNSTGMKGAIKQFADEFGAETQKNDLLIKIFGSDADANKAGKQKNTQQGESIFFTAHLLALPVRTNKLSYILTTSPELIRFYEELRKKLCTPVSESIFGKDHNLVNNITPSSGICFNDVYSGVELDIVGTSLTHSNDSGLLSNLQKLFGIKHDRICIVSDITMAELCSDLYLPVISRNALDDGESKNLWYEQILPRFSILYFANLWNDDEQKNFIEACMISDHSTIKHPLQIGGNASVSYGFTFNTKID